MSELRRPLRAPSVGDYMAHASSQQSQEAKQSVQQTQQAQKFSDTAGQLASNQPANQLHENSWNKRKAPKGQEASLESSNGPYGGSKLTLTGATPMIKNLSKSIEFDANLSNSCKVLKIHANPLIPWKSSEYKVPARNQASRLNLTSVTPMLRNPRKSLECQDFWKTIKI